MPRFLGERRDAIAGLQRQRATKKKGSRAWRSLSRRIAGEYRRARNQSDNWARDTAGRLVEQYGVIVLEDLKLQSMTKSAKGTTDAPGVGVAAKSGLNRSLNEAALGRLHHWICAKAEEAGRRSWVVPPQNTSRRCARCSHVARENRKYSRFWCTRCGHQDHADVNAAVNIAVLGAHAESAWRAANAPRMERVAPKLQRHKDRPSHTGEVDVGLARSA
jgi:putative transposase